jgi:uncharacterized Zn-binding protein involved in type VI secretion
MNPCHVTLEGRTPIRQNGGAQAVAQKDVCLTPSSTGWESVNYVNVALASALQNGSTTVTIGGAPVMLEHSTLFPSTGDEAGTGGGVISKTTCGQTEAISTTSTVSIEGQGVVRNGDVTMQNNKNATGTLAGGC